MKYLFTLLGFLAVSVPVIAQSSADDISDRLLRYIAREKTIMYKLGDRVLPVRIIQYGDLKNIVCINLHDNETTSVEAARSVLELKGGTLVKIDNNNERFIQFNLRGASYGFDPNGIFSRAGIEKTLKENGPSGPFAVTEIEKFANRLLELIPETATCWIALHNNTDEDYSLTTYLKGNERQNDAKAVFRAPGQDTDDIIFTTDSSIYRKMSEKGFNSIWQDNQKARKDGSLSVYCGERGKRYVNIETEHGKFELYAEMLSTLMAILTKEYKNDPVASPRTGNNRSPSQKPVDN